MFRAFKALMGVVVTTCLAAGLVAVAPGGALAAGLQVCVPSFAGATLRTPRAGVCKAGYKKSELPSEEQTAIMAHMKYEATGIGGKPTIEISGVNVQIVNGEGETATDNGEGNLVIGYDEEPGAQSGSHNLILGGPQQTFTSYGGILGGSHNTISSRYASVTGGNGNTASGPWALVTGGVANVASGGAASVAGGANNTAEGEFASVSGGYGNGATGDSSIGGGYGNIAASSESSISGGESNEAVGEGASWIGGGYKNRTHAFLSSIFGGTGLGTTGSTKPAEATQRRAADPPRGREGCATRATGCHPRRETPEWRSCCRRRAPRHGPPPAGRLWRVVGSLSRTIEVAKASV